MVFSCKSAVYFQNIFSQEHLWRAAYGIIILFHANVHLYFKTSTSSDAEYREVLK